jgi:hypothetical protein
MDPAELAQHRAELTLAEEPDDAQTVLDVRAVMFGEDPSDAAHVHVEGEEGESTEEAEHAHEAAADDHDAESTDGEGEDEHADHDDEADHDHEHAETKTPKLTELEVVLVGVVGGVPNPSEQSHPDFPFVENQAMFFLADPEAVAEMEEHSHQHAPGEVCAFCAAHAPDTLLAVVQFQGKNGKPLPVDARELFDLKEKETVVVRGTARLAPGGMMTVEATGLYARR